ncbi:MAG TPA: glycosyltransferase family protein, partial [Hyphomicrobiaceae bacterium]|nr:glycosyltransferase family protein [Hyphomicrobiaceae bacterium]
MNTVAIIQARMTSTRLPGKVLAEFAGQPMLSYMLDRVRRAQSLDGILIATTLNHTDDPVVDLCHEVGVAVFRGSEADVLGRYAAAAADAQADTIVRLTADCPLIDPHLIDQAVSTFREGGFDYLSNSIQLSYPDGLDVEVFTRSALARANAEANLPFHREHVTP